MLGAWAGALLMTGASAAIIFPEMRHIGANVADLILPADEHWKFVAGRVQNRVFGVCDWVQIFCGAGVLLLTADAARRKPWRHVGRRLWLARLAITALTLTALATYLAWLAPAMQADLRAFWQALEAKDLAAARTAQTSFDAYHPVASRFFTGMFAGVIALAVLTALGIGRADPRVTRHAD